VVFFPSFENFRWEDGLADRLQYDASGNVKTEIVKTPFVQVTPRYQDRLCCIFEKRTEKIKQKNVLYSGCQIVPSNQS
jgi:hypothetical protein